MKIQTNTTDRKALVKAIAAELHTEARYMRTPTYAYQIGDFTVDRDGNIIGEDFAPLHDFLLANGYITEEPETATETEPAEDAAENANEDANVLDEVTEDTEDEAEDADADAPVEVTETEPTEDAAEDAPVEAADKENTEAIAKDAAADLEAPIEASDVDPADEADADSEEEQQPADATADTPAETAALTDDSDPDTQTITIPAPGITAAQLRNLTFILYSRQYLLGLMTGAETIHIPLDTVQSLQRAMPDTAEDFSLFLKIHRMSGLKGFDFKDGQFSMTFPFCENEPARWTAFAGLQGRILQAAMTAKRVAPDFIQPEEEAEKYTAHIWLQRLGYRGPEMKEQRNILLHHLHGYCAFSNGEKMQNHKDKYGAIRRERREAERAAAQTVAEASAPMPIAPETTAPTSTAPEAIAPETTAPETTTPATTEDKSSLI